MEEYHTMAASGLVTNNVDYVNLLLHFQGLGFREANMTRLGILKSISYNSTAQNASGMASIIWIGRQLHKGMEVGMQKI